MINAPCKKHSTKLIQWQCNICEIELCGDCDAVAFQGQILCKKCNDDLDRVNDKKKHKVDHGSIFTIFSKIKDADQAKKVLKEMGSVFYVAAGLSLIPIFFLKSLENVVDLILWVMCGYAVRKYFSRTAALITLISASFVVWTTGQNLMTKSTGGSNIYLAVLIFLCSLRACYASYLYHKFIQSTVNLKNIIIKSFLALVYGLLISFFILFLVGLYLATKQIKPGEDFMVYSWLSLIIVNIFLVFRGWLPFTANKSIIKYTGPLCQDRCSLKQL